MDKVRNSQILKLFLMAILLSITPLLSTSLRPPYLYFVLNLLIIALGAEAGLLSFILKASEDKKTPPKNILPSEDSPSNKERYAKTITTKETILESEPITTKKKPKILEKSSSEKVVGTVKVHETPKKCLSTPSLSFIGGGGETEAEEFSSDDYFDDLEDVVEDELSGQELFQKAETFIGNFYKQLKMQREDSWNRIHGLYQKAF